MHPTERLSTLILDLQVGFNRALFGQSWLPMIPRADTAMERIQVPLEWEMRATT